MYNIKITTEESLKGLNSVGILKLNLRDTRFLQRLEKFPILTPTSLGPMGLFQWLISRPLLSSNCFPRWAVCGCTVWHQPWRKALTTPSSSSILQQFTCLCGLAFFYRFWNVDVFRVLVTCPTFGLSACRYIVSNVCTALSTIRTFTLTLAPDLPLLSPHLSFFM